MGRRSVGEGKPHSPNGGVSSHCCFAVIYSLTWNPGTAFRAIASALLSWEFPNPGVRLLPVLGYSVPNLWEKTSLSVFHSAQANIVSQEFPVLLCAVNRDTSFCGSEEPLLEEPKLVILGASHTVRLSLFPFNVGTRWLGILTSPQRQVYYWESGKGNGTVSSHH